jgi:hypothetical protein
MTKKHEPGMAYDMNKLNRLFAFLSILLLVAVGWLFLDDYLRPWKAIQIQGQKIKKEKLAKKIELEEKKINQQKLKQLKTSLVELEKSIKAKDQQNEGRKYHQWCFEC